MKRKTTAELEHQVAGWNQLWPVGLDVIVQLDDRSQRATKTESEAWVMGGHSAMIRLEGISGGYMLDRVKPVFNP